MRSDYTGLSALYDMLMDDVAYDAWAERLDTLFKQTLAEAPRVRVADCACGTGALTVRLKKMGYDITGSDISEDMLRVAYDKAMKAGLRIPFAHMDMTELQVMRPVHAVNCSCDGVNYLTAMERVKRFFTAAYCALLPGGILTFDVSTRYKLEQVIGCNTFGEDRESCTYLWQNTYDPENKLAEMRLAFFTPAPGGTYKRFDETHIQRAHSHRELTNALNECGFALIGAYDGLTDEPVNEKSERALYVAKKQ